MNNITKLLRSPALADLDRRGMFAVGAASVTMSVLLFAMPLYSLQVFDRVLTSRSADTLVMLTLIVAFALLSVALIEAIRNRLLLRIGNAFAVRLSPRLLDACINQSSRTSKPDGQPVRDVLAVRAFLSSGQGLTVLFDAPLSPLFLLAVFMIHVGLGIAMLLGMGLLLLIAFFTELIVNRGVKQSAEAMLLSQQRTEAVMQNADAIEAMGMREGIVNYWRVPFHTVLAEGSAAGDRTSGLSALAKFARLGFSLGMTALGAWYAIHGEITMGGMVASSILAARGMAPLEMLIGAWKSMIGAQTAVERINKALETFPRKESAMALPAPSSELSVERLIYFPPGAEQPTLKGLSFALPSSTWLGVVGPSAAGKSTLLKLICGIWQPRSGIVRLDGADVYTWGRDDFGQYCGYLPQDVELFAGTVRDNIARFGNCSDEQVIEAAQKANVHDMILRLPRAYETQIGAGGAYLSAGQRQRIGLARAMLGNPRLLILDEPNSNLDSEGEQALVDAISQARTAGTTIVMVSHRPSLLAGADMIAVMLDGQLQKFGRRDEVLGTITPVAATGSSALEARRVIG